MHLDVGSREKPARQGHGPSISTIALVLEEDMEGEIRVDVAGAQLLGRAPLMLPQHSLLVNVLWPKHQAQGASILCKGPRHDARLRSHNFGLDGTQRDPVQIIQPDHVWF